MWRFFNFNQSSRFDHHSEAKFINPLVVKLDLKKNKLINQPTSSLKYEKGVLIATFLKLFKEKIEKFNHNSFEDSNQESQEFFALINSLSEITLSFFSNDIINMRTDANKAKMQKVTNTIPGLGGWVKHVSGLSDNNTETYSIVEKLLKEFANIIAAYERAGFTLPKEAKRANALELSSY